MRNMLNRPFLRSFSIRKRDGSISESIEKVRGFLDYERHKEPYRAPEDRVHDWQELHSNNDGSKHSHTEIQIQASRCMDCGTPFCQTYTGCPVHNLIPEWNELVFKNNWKEAVHRLQKTNNFPEFTGRVCPAPCEGSCVAGLVDEPVTIKDLEYSIVERGFEEGWIVPRIPMHKTGLKVAIIGSGPAGLACADQLNQSGHDVTVYEREDRIGGLLMYGIPNMKLEKSTVDRRVNLLSQEGIIFKTNVNVGKEGDDTMEALRRESDAVVLCTGSTVPRDLPLPGRELKGVHYAMEFLTANQKRLLMTVDGTLESGWDKSFITAEGKDVVVIGGGDTGTDCVGTSMRQRCKSLTNFELNAQPPMTRSENNPWPEWPRVFGVDYGHAECKAIFGHDPREYKIMTKEFKGNEKGELCSIVTMEAERQSDGSFAPVSGSEKEWPCDLAILSMGFIHPEKELMDALDVDVDDISGNIAAVYGDFRTNQEGIFAAGDSRRGQSLVVWAIHEGRESAAAVENYFSSMNLLPTVDAQYAS